MEEEDWIVGAGCLESRFLSKEKFELTGGFISPPINKCTDECRYSIAPKFG
jgi:hypothetical protein